jgi:hypothetical protein
MSANEYIIQCYDIPDCCVGVNWDVRGAPLTICSPGDGDALTRWLFDPETGHIALSASPDLFLNFPSFIPSEGLPLVLGAKSQSWNWAGNPPFISFGDGPGVIDGGNLVFGQQIRIQHQNGKPSQAWRLLPV